MLLADAITVARRFQRSVRIDMDLGAAAALHGFVCQGSGRAALETMARCIIEGGQRAFTWTGPYGSGKSSLALALAAAVGRSDTGLRNAARELLGEVTPLLDDAFPPSDTGWIVVPVVGRRADPVEDVSGSIELAIGRRRRGDNTKSDDTGRSVIQRLLSIASGESHAGLLLLIDEMGKYLEAAAGEAGDIYFFQELAEAAARSNGRLVVIGILHQSFDQYATRLGRDSRDDWAKVQGRFIDIPIVSAVDEVIDLLGRAIEARLPHPETKPISEQVAAAIAHRRPGTPGDLAARLDAAWPLHPIVAALLGPVSRRRFGQNERSTFGFLTSSEPEGFKDFLRRTPANEGTTYDPAQLWDYLRLNLEHAILASPDGHRWALGAEAVERCESRGGPLHLRLIKTLALVDLFRNGTGIVAEPEILRASLKDVAPALVDRALADLEEWSIAIFRKHLGAWSIYAGSDFDIEAAVEAAKAASADLDLSRLATLAGLQPQLAKQHYMRTGTLRWFHSELVPIAGLRERVHEFEVPAGAGGALLLAIPAPTDTHRKALHACRLASETERALPIAIGLPCNALTIRDLGVELTALETVRVTRPELEGDSVARREITARIAAISAQLEEELRSGLAGAAWYVGGKPDTETGPRALPRLVSRLADAAFPLTPIIHSELVNRDRPSSNSQAAVRALLHAMIKHPDQEYLAIEGFPAERGLYSTILGATGWHRHDGERFRFAAPSHPSLRPLWSRAESLLAATDDAVPVTALYRLWSAPPFGVRRGLLPILALAFALAQRSTIAVYAQGVFRPELDSYVADLLLQDEALLTFRLVDLKGEKQSIVEAVATAVEEFTNEAVSREPLAVARALVRFALRLPPWSQKTARVSPTARELRRVLLTASDPHRALFLDLPLAIGATGSVELGRHLHNALRELAEVQPKMLGELQKRMLAALGHGPQPDEALRRRARTIFGLSGDLQLDGFAGQLLEFSGGTEEMEALASLALKKPPREWSDRDPDTAAIELAELALRFRRAETLASVKDRTPTRHALAVVFGTGEAGRTVMRTVDIADSEQAAVTGLAEDVLAVLTKSGAEPRLVMAALAEAGVRAVEAEPIEDYSRKAS